MGWRRKPERQAMNETEEGNDRWLSPSFEIYSQQLLDGTVNKKEKEAKRKKMLLLQNTNLKN